MSSDKADRAGRGWTRGDQAWVRPHSKGKGRSRHDRREHGCCPPDGGTVTEARARTRPAPPEGYQNRTLRRAHERNQGLDKVVGYRSACSQTQPPPDSQSGRFEVTARLA